MGEIKDVAVEELKETKENINGDNLHESEPMKPFIRLKNDVGSEDIHYSLFYRGIPEEFKDVALEELNETEENIAIGLLKLRDFLKDKGISDVEDYTLLTVLRNCKYNIENSEIKLMKYLQTQDMVTKRLQTVDLERLENVLNHRAIGFLPYRDKHGRAIIYTTPYDLNLESFDLDDAALCAFCILFYALNFPLTSVTGLAYIAENKYPSLSLCYPVIKAFKQYVPTVLTLPFRIAKIEMLNENFIIRWAYNLAKAVLASKIIQRVKFYGSDIQGLHKFYHPAILPEEFGGTMGPLNSKWFWEDFLIFVKKLKSRNLYLS